MHQFWVSSRAQPIWKHHPRHTGFPMDREELSNALRAALHDRLAGSDTPHALLTQAEGELAQWARLPPASVASADILALVREVVAQERQRLTRVH